jgi:hypothetical protein
MADPTNTNGWGEYKKFVIHELERMNDRLEVVDKRLSKIDRNLTILQTKAYVAAAVVAIIFSGIVSVIITKVP